MVSADLDLKTEDLTDSRQGSHTAQYFSYRLISDATSPQSISRIKHWLDDCTANHPSCKRAMSSDSISNTTSLPTRILDVANYPKTICLIITAKKKVQKAKHVALSYCWGGVAQIKTTRVTLERHQKSIPCESLPQTIQDAAWITRKLGLRFLWVDCLCILQEDRHDFHAESRRMASVYEKAYLAIAATGANASTKSIFERSPQAEYVARPSKVSGADLEFLYLSQHKLLGTTIFDAPLNRRGWVLQEHLFARRTIHFAADQIYWECDKSFVGEDGVQVTNKADMIFPNRSLLLHILNNYKDVCRDPKLRKNKDDEMCIESDVFGIWAKLVSFYSTRSLTDERDKLPAVLSLMLEIESTIRISQWPIHFHQGCLFGVPYLELECLLWRAQSNQPLRRPQQFRAPTWSWASIDGAIEFLDLFIKGRPSFTFLDIWIPKDSDLKIVSIRDYTPPGMCSRESLLLEGVTLECSALASADTATRLEYVYTPEGDRFDVNLTFDFPSRPPMKFWLIPAFIRWTDEPSPYYLCLIARSVATSTVQSISTVFERVGSGYIFDVDRISRYKRRSLLVI